MSRSALQQQMLKDQRRLQQQRSAPTQIGMPPPPPPHAPPHALQQQGYMHGYPGMAPETISGIPGTGSAMGSVVGQAFVPIPLTGDDEDDNAASAAASKSNVLPMYGNTSNYNINNLLFNNIMENDYFRALYQLRTYHEVIDEIYRSVDHVEPWQTGTTRFPSTAFCLLVKFLLMRLTMKQMNGLLNTEDAPFVKVIGLLYLRYTCPPNDLWKWYEPFLEDPEEFSPSCDKTAPPTTIGAYCIRLLTEMQYMGTTLPRIPVPIERKMKVMLLLLEEKKRRREQNRAMQHKFVAGAKVRAIYGDEENEPAWYEAVIDSRDEETENKFWVTYTEYGNTECVDLGDMELLLSHPAVPSSHTDDTMSAAETGSDYPAATADRAGNPRKRDRSEDSRDSGRDYRRRSSSRDRESSRHRRSSRDRNGADRNRDRDKNRGYNRHGSNSRDRSRHSSYRSRSRSWDRDNGNENGNANGRGERSRRSRSRSNSSSYRGGTGAAAAAAAASSSHDLMRKVLEKERQASAAVGRQYGSRPASYKGSLSLKADRYTARRKSPSPPSRARSGGAAAAGGGGGGGSGASRRRSRSRSPQQRHTSRRGDDTGAEGRAGGGGSGGSARAATDAERVKQLKARYGDASAN